MEPFKNVLFRSENGDWTFICDCETRETMLPHIRKASAGTVLIWIQHSGHMVTLRRTETGFEESL